MAAATTVHLFLDSMKASDILFKSATCTAVVILLIALSGCVVPYPHTTTRSFEISGRIVDSKAGLPIAGARIQPLAIVYGTNTDRVPRMTTTPIVVSDNEGRFKLPRSSKMLWTTVVLAPCYDSISGGGECHFDYIVSLNGYVPVEFSVLALDRNIDHIKNNNYIVGDIPLAAGDSQVPERLLRPKTPK